MLHKKGHHYNRKWLQHRLLIVIAELVMVNCHQILVVSSENTLGTVCSGLIIAS